MPAADPAAGSSTLIRFRVRRKAGARLNRRLLRDLSLTVLRAEGIDAPFGVSLHFVDDDEIRGLNAAHRGIDRPTDVLSFSLADDAAPHFVLPPNEPRELGDVVISYPRAVEQAREYGHSIERELGYLVAHGLLHILGHDHEDEYEQAAMRSREEAALSAVGLTR